MLVLYKTLCGSIIIIIMFGAAMYVSDFLVIYVYIAQNFGGSVPKIILVEKTVTA